MMVATTRSPAPSPAHPLGASRTEIDWIDVRIGAAIGERRRAVGLSREELGARIGLSGRQVENCEQGRRRISASHLACIAHHLNVEPAWFFDALAAPAPAASDEERVADAFARIDKPAVRASVVALLEALALQSATWTPRSTQKG